MQNSKVHSTRKMYTIRDLTQLDYEPCLDLLQDPVYKRLFAYSDLETLHLEC